MRMDPSWRRSRSYSDMANTQRRHALQLQTLVSGNSPQTIWLSPRQTCCRSNRSGCASAPAYDSGTLPTLFSPGRWTQTVTRPTNILCHILSLHTLQISRHYNNFSTCGPPDVQLYKNAEITGNPWNEPEGPRPMGTA